MRAEKVEKKGAMKVEEKTKVVETTWEGEMTWVVETRTHLDNDD